MYFLIIVAIFSLFLGAYVLSRNTGSVLNRLFFVLAVVCTLWILTNVFSGLFHSIFWIKSAYSFGAFVPGAALIWLLYLTRLKIKRINFFIIIFLELVFFVLPYIDGLIIKDVETVLLGRFIGKVGVLFPLYAFYQLSMFILMIFTSYIAYRKAVGIKKEQLKFVLVGVLLTAIIVFVVSFILPLFNNLKYTFLDSPSLIIFLSFITYAITRYRLFNIKYFITRSILYTILVAALASFFTLTVVWVGNKIGGNIQTNNIIIFTIDSILVVIFLPYLKKFLGRITDNIFFKDKIDYQAVLQEASNVASREIDLQIMLSKLTLGLAGKLKIKQVTALVPQNDKHLKLIAASDPSIKDLRVSDNFRSYLAEHHDFAITEELIRDLDRLPTDSQERVVLDGFIKEAEGLKAEMVIPVVEQGRLTAIFLLSAKNSGDLYSQDDINFFKVLTPQIATAIEKSKLYEELQELNRQLQAKVEEKTKSLREANVTLEDRNKFLTTMQVVTNMITRTLDLGKAYQMIADSIASELGYVGGILSFIDEKTNSLRLAAITQNNKTGNILKMLPQSAHDYRTNLDNGGNLGSETVLSGKIQFADKLSDFLSPPVPKDVLDKIQEHLGIRTVVGVPIFSEARIIGVIRFLLAVKREKISATDIETMTALTNQAGIVSRNLRLYENLQKANVDLQDANLKLKELDKAKSEFLSIASHQLRTPISAIKGYLSMMLEGDFGTVPDKITKVLKDLFESSSRLARLVNIFLNVSRIESGRLKLEKHALQITNLIDSVITELTQQAVQKNVKLSFQHPKKSAPLILADSDKLREVVLNLIDNAIKYTPKGSINISLVHDDNQLTFISQDTGIGIDPTEAPNLFRKFVRGSGVAQIHTGGSGLGLFIAQKIIKEHGGEIWAESEGKDKGTTFKFTVPLFKEEEK